MMKLEVVKGSCANEGDLPLYLVLKKDWKSCVHMQTYVSVSGG